jgi:nitroreductase
MDALQLLLGRRSNKALAAPGPDAEALELILQAALRVPDFLELRPYEFLVAEGEGRERLGRLFQEAAIAEARASADVRRAPSMPLRAPVVITVVAKARENDTVHRLEQTMTAGCAVMAMQMAALALGYGGIWRSGWPMFNRRLHELLGLTGEDQIVGFLYLGTPQKKPEPLPRVESRAFTRWI